jgi:anaphase-promoting complex subunit 8
MHSTPAKSSHTSRPSLSFSESDAGGDGGLADAEADEEEADLLEVAKTYYAMKELDRASHLLRDCKGPKARFLSIYCRYLVSTSDTKPGAQYLTIC